MKCQAQPVPRGTIVSYRPEMRWEDRGVDSTVLGDDVRRNSCIRKMVVTETETGPVSSS